MPRLLADDERAGMVAAAIVPFSRIALDSGRLPNDGPSDRRAVMQVHCHEYAAGRPGRDIEALQMMGFSDVEVPPGCCGLAGNFGLQPGHSDLSHALARRRLIPAIEKQPTATIVANGFSCRTQIRTEAKREPVHVAQLLADFIAGEVREGRGDERD
jgi:Fe-S oxidoreductase